MRNSQNPAAVPPQRIAELAAKPDDTIDTSDIPEAGPEVFEQAELHNSAAPAGSWEPIESNPKTGFDVLVRWNGDDNTMRAVRWHSGRRFHEGRWQAGGRWTPADDLGTPLPAEPPTEWYKPPEPPAEEVEGEAA